MPRTLVLSAHGSDRKSSIAKLPEGITIHFYVKNNTIYCSDSNFQSKVCLGETVPSHSIRGGEMYPSSMHFTSNWHKNFQNKNWYKNFNSGVVDCESKYVLINIDDMRSGINLGRVIEILIGMLGTNFDLHMFTCSVNTNLNAPPPKYSNVNKRTISGVLTDSFSNMKLEAWQ